MKNTWTQKELEDLGTFIIRRVVASKVPMSDLENRYVNEHDFTKRAEMADDVSAHAHAAVRTLVKALKKNNDGDEADRAARERSIDDFVNRLTGRVGPPGGFGSLAYAMKSVGFNLKGNSKVEDIPLSTAFGYEFKAGTLDGGTDIEDVNPRRVTQPELGFDERFLAPHMGAVGIDFTETSVPSFRQKSRNLGTASSGVRTIGDTSNKPEVGTVSEVVTAECKQIAWVESGTR